MMGAEDASNAYERVLKLGLNTKQEREIVRVLVDCCGQEKNYNPFYASLGKMFCEMDSQFRFTFQLSFWDVFQQVGREYLSLC